MPSLKVRISPPIQPIPRGLGFYQSEDESLHVLIGGSAASRRFFSFIDSPSTRFDLDREGRIMFCEIAAPKKGWQTIEDLNPPSIIEAADVRWMDFRKSIETPEFFTNEKQDRLLILLSHETAEFNYYLAESVILQVSRSDNACALLVSEIVDDSAGRKISAFKKEMRGQLSWSSHLKRMVDIPATRS